MENLYTYQGKTDTLYHLCKEYGVQYTTVKNRLKRGMSVKEAFAVPNKEKIEYTYKGKTGTISYLCKNFGFSVTTIKNRLAKGMTIEEAFETPIQNYSKGPFKYKGVVKGNLVDLCDYFNVPIDSVRNRVYRGMSLEEAFDKAIRSKSDYLNVSIKSYTDYNNKIATFINKELEKTFLVLNRKINENIDYIINELKNGESMENIMKDLY